MSRLPFYVRATDVVHRATVLTLLGITVAGLGSIGFNVYANSDYAKMNRQKLTFSEEQYDDARKENHE